MTVKCAKCGSENPSDSGFCNKCGTQIKPASAEIPASQTETLQTPVKELATGTTFAGRYQIIEELGKGGMGKVYKVYDTKIKEKIALKLIKPEIASDRETIERFSNELRLSRKIGHRNVCRMFDLGEAEGAHFITMEYVHGEDLKSMIRMSGSLSLGMLLNVGKQVCSGLSEAHSLGIVHRDLKPTNIMIDKGGNAKIMDFGIARSTREKGITGPSVLIGTPEYMSPEQAEAKQVDPSSDIYSLGVILYEMATSHVPFEGETALSIAMKHKGEIPKEPKQFNPNIPDDLSRVILRCLEKDKADRYQTASEVLSELDKIEKGIPTTDRVIPERKPFTAKEITVTFGLKKLLLPALGLLCLVIAAVVIWKILPKEEAAPAPSAKRSIAVLSFADLSPAKDREYLCDGIAQTLINALSRIEELRVPAATSAFSFKGKGADIKEIGEKLAVEAVLEGSIQIAGNRLRVNAQLINVNDGYHLWSEKYEKNVEDVFAVQDDIAQKIVEALKIKLLGETKAQIVKRYTENREAYDLYMQGVYFYNKREKENLENAVGYLERAIEIDPKYALAYAQLAETYATIGDWGYLAAREAFPRAKEAAQKALEIDDSLAEAHCALAQVEYNFDWDWQSAEEEFKKSLSLNPNYATGHMQYGEFLTKLGRFDEAALEMDLAQELDPLSLMIRAAVAWRLNNSGQYDLAIAQSEEVLKMDPSFGPAQEYLDYALFLKCWVKGMYKEALEICQKSNNQSGMALVYAKTGKAREAKKILESFISRQEQPGLRYYIAMLLFSLGEQDQGFQWLEKAYEDRDYSLTYIRNEPFFDSVRDDPRFLALLNKVGLKNS